MKHFKAELVSVLCNKRTGLSWLINGTASGKVNMFNCQGRQKKDSCLIPTWGISVNDPCCDGAESHYG